MKAVQEEVQGIITSAIKAYINSSQHDYPRAEQMINDVIRIVCAHDDHALLSFAENEMANFGLAEKLILLKRLKKSVEVLPSTTEILARRRFAENRPAVERECLSNFEIHLQEAA
jgi:hypothetical protein